MQRGQIMIDSGNAPNTRKPLRLWPGVAAVALLLLVRFGLPIVVPGAVPIAVLGGVIGGLVVILWWLFFSRACWTERVGALVVMAVALFAASRFLDKSIATGAQGLLFIVLAVPVLSLAFVAWAVAAQRLSDGPRRTLMVTAIFIACGVWTLVKTGGFTGSFENDLMWRWTKTPEERLLSQTHNESMARPPSAAPGQKGAEWPGFRGPDRDGVVRGVRIDTDWSRSPPVQLWRRPIGPGWSSFAVRDDLLYTQEQRGEEEVVACYKMSTGEPVWRHSDAVRFWESNAGAGPRATPALSNGRVYSFGATGILDALDAGTGALVWSRNVAAESDTKVPGWGFSGSPLVVGDTVIVAASGKLVAYDALTGKPRWSGPREGGSYSSPQLLTIAGVPQVLLLSGNGVTSVESTNGTVLWKHPWPGDTIVQPARLSISDILVSTAGGGRGVGTRRLAVSNGPAGWTASERWTSAGLKPYFNDSVVHKGHAFGFDGSILACIDLEDGQRKWKDGRYGNGQLVLLADQDALLVLSEQGQLALVEANPGQFKELARFPAIEGKSWNHPAVAGDILLVRNSQEMAAFKLPLQSGERGPVK